MATSRQRRTGGPRTAHPAPAFVGRQDALTTLVDALRDGPSVVLVEGEAGIGKTRLVREALAAIPGGPATRAVTGRRIGGRVRPGSGHRPRVLLAASPPLPEPFPLGAPVSGIRRLLAQAETPRPATAGLSALCGALRPLFPELADQLPPAPEPLAEPRETRYRLLCALTELVESLEVDVLVVEDAHWADQGTLEWLLLLLAGGEPAMSLVVTYRPTDVPDGSLLRRLTARSTSDPGRVRITLEPLELAEIQRLVGSMLDTDQVSEKFAAFLREHAGGIPLALEETVRLLRERHDITRQRGAWWRRILADLEVPPAVRDSVRERVDRLPGDARRILQAASVISDRADEALLATVAELAEPAGHHGLAAALGSGLLQEVASGRYTFRHVLDAQAIETAIPVPQRRRLHHRAALALRDRPHPSAAGLARHFRAAGDIRAWCEHAEAATDLAVTTGDDHTAVVTLLAVLDTAELPPGQRLRLARKLGEAAFFGAAAIGELAPQVAGALRAVLATADLPAVDRGELRLQLGRMLWTVGDGLAAFEEMEAAIPDLGHRPELARHAMINISHPVVPEWPADRHRRWLRRAGELVERSDLSTWDRRHFDYSRATTLLLLGEEAGWELAGRLSRSATTSHRQRLLASSLLNLAEASLPWGRYHDTQRFIDAGTAHLESSGYQRRRSMGELEAALLAWYTGRWQGLRAAAVAIAESDPGEPREGLQARQVVGLLDLAAGARTRAEPALREVGDEYVRLHRIEPADLAVPAALARLYLNDGDAAAALRYTRPAMALIARKGVWLWISDIAPAHVAALLAAGERERAGELVRDLASGLAGLAAPAPAAALTTCRAALALAGDQPRAAADLFARAAEAWAALPRPYDELLARERYGRCLLAAGETEPGLAALAQAQQRLHQLGAGWDADRIAQVLRRHGVDVPRPNRRGPRGYGDQLSPREREVVELVTRGMTNKQIGERLFLSPKTVDRHLRSARRKLGTTTRIDTALAVADAGLPPDRSG